MKEAPVKLAFAGLHPDRLRSLVERWGSNEAVVGAIERGRIEVTADTARRIAVPAADRIGELSHLGVRLVLDGGVDFPDRLSTLPDGPVALFVRGDLPTGAAVAIVGTRRCTTYGREVARVYGTALARAGFVVVSGLARGIDGAAHRGMVDASGRGIAVLGSGPDVIYPPEHAGLVDDIVACGGATITEYPPGTPPEPWRFPVRNRVIAGLADALVIVEAAERGGALITASRALEYGVPVFAVPGDVDRETSVGCNLLIRDGAHPVLDADDLLEELSLLPVCPQPPTSRSRTPREHVERPTAPVESPPGRLGEHPSRAESTWRPEIESM